MTGQSIITDINGIILINCEEHHPVRSTEKVIVEKRHLCKKLVE